jgi:peptidoglycan/LPS O-acetylase OafA/YrhL
MNNRNTLLDGLRGLLSLIVMLNHSFLVVAIPSYADVWGQNYFAYFDFSSKIQQIMMILGNGGAAVSMFFVLSGFVLNYSLGKISWNPKSYIYFLFKRLLRLYPAFFFTITLISIFRWLGFDYRQFPHASTWYHWWMNFKLDGLEYFLNTIFLTKLRNHFF